MKTFLEEYGFVILIAIVIILLIVMATPVGNSIKASVLSLVDRFSGTVTSKLDKTKTERTTALNGSTLTIVSDSETDKFVAILHGVQGGKEVSKLSDATGKIECTDTMDNIATFDGVDVSDAIETTDGTASFEIVNPENLDEGSKYYLEIMNIGTGEIFKSDVSTVDYAKMNTIGGGSGGSGGSGSTSGIDMSKINVMDGTKILAAGDFSTKGSLVTINNTQYRVLAVDGTMAKVMSMANGVSSEFNSSSVTASFGGTNGQKYAGSILDNAMTNYYNSLPSAIQNAIVEQNINQSMYKRGSDTNANASFSSWYRDPFTDTTISGNNYYLTRIAEVNVGTRKVFALDVDDVINYLGSNSTAKDVNEMFFEKRNSVSRNVWLRSAYSGRSSRAFYVYGYSGDLNRNYYGNSSEVRPAFVLDLSLLS